MWYVSGTVACAWKEHDPADLLFLLIDHILVIARTLSCLHWINTEPHHFARFRFDRWLLSPFLTCMTIIAQILDENTNPARDNVITVYFETFLFCVRGIDHLPVFKMIYYCDCVTFTTMFAYQFCNVIIFRQSLLEVLRGLQYRLRSHRRALSLERVFLGRYVEVAPFEVTRSSKMAVPLRLEIQNSFLEVHGRYSIHLLYWLFEGCLGLCCWLWRLVPYARRHV